MSYTQRLIEEIEKEDARHKKAMQRIERTGKFIVIFIWAIIFFILITGVKI